MIKRRYTLTIIELLICIGWAYAQNPSTSVKPTPPRTWTVTNGTELEAIATGFDNGSVTFRNRQGTISKVPLTTLSEADQTYLKEFFAPPPPAFPLGQPAGPVDTGEGTTYHVYLSANLDNSTPVPLLVFTGAGGGKANSYKHYQEAIDHFGWAFIAVTESKNGNDGDVNFSHTKKAMEHAVKTLNIDSKRVYYTGNSGGGAMAFYNACSLKGQGAIPIIAYIPGPANIEPPHGYFYVVGGAKDYNRYLSARASKAFGKKSVHRFHSGGHSTGPAWILCDGVAWLETQYFMDRSNRVSPTRRAKFQEKMLGWINTLEASEPHRAYYWALFMNKEYKVNGPHADGIRLAGRTLAKDPKNRKFAAGLDALDEFSEKVYGEVGGGSSFNHITPEIQDAAKKLAETYAGTPAIEDIAKALGEPTVGN